MNRFTHDEGDKYSYFTIKIKCFRFLLSDTCDVFLQSTKSVVDLSSSTGDVIDDVNILTIL